MRYKFYCEHKYVSAAINDVERLIAKTDFRVAAEVKKVKGVFDSLLQMLSGHAQYEDQTLHELLKKKGLAFARAWQGIQVKLDPHERDLLAQKLA